MFTAGAFFGAAFAGPSGDKLGRRWTITVGCVLFCLGGGLQTGARTVAFLYSGRFFAGLGYATLYSATGQNHGLICLQGRFPYYDYPSVPG